MVPPSFPHRIHLPCVKLTPGSRLQIIFPHAISCSPLSGPESLAPRLDSYSTSWRRQRIHTSRLCGPATRIWGGIVWGGGFCIPFVLLVHPGAASLPRRCPCAVAVELVCAARCLKSSLFIKQGLEGVGSRGLAPMRPLYSPLERRV